jgi:hypothetical protein
MNTHLELWFGYMKLKWWVRDTYTDISMRYEKRIEGKELRERGD